MSFLATRTLLAANIFLLSLHPAEAQTTPSGNNIVTSRPSAATWNRITRTFNDSPVLQDDWQNNLDKYLGLSALSSFKTVKDEVDKLGIRHLSFQQYYNGIPVEGGLIMAHLKDGKTTYLNGYIVSGQMNTMPVITSAEALAIAKSTCKATKSGNENTRLVIAHAGDQCYLAYRVQLLMQENNGRPMPWQLLIDAATGEVKQKIDDVRHTDVAATGTTLYNGVQNITVDDMGSGSYRLRDNARGIETYNGGGIPKTMSGYYLLDLDYNHTSTTWNQFPFFNSTTIQTANPNLISNVGGSQTGTLAYTFGFPSQPGWLGLWRMTERFVSSGTAIFAPPATNNDLYCYMSMGGPHTGYYLKVDVVNNQAVVTDSASYQVTTRTPGTYNWSDGNGNSGTYTISLKENPAIDVHWGLEQVYDHYLNRFNRVSYDNNGSTIRSYINTGDPLTAQAQPAPYNYMEYGMGDGSMFRPSTMLDVVGHEYTHMVTANNGNGGLDYMGESGALNESFSDIFGTCVEFAVKGQNANWTIGEGLYVNNSTKAMRSMSNPKATLNPDTYQGILWMDPTDLTMDNGGVHANSNVQNKWFYLLATGGSGTNDKQNQYNVTGIGITKAEDIAYRNLTNYLTPTATFMDAYAGSLQAATDLYGYNSPEYIAVRKAWYAVGIGNDPTDVVTIDGYKTAVTCYPNPARNAFRIKGLAHADHVIVNDISGAAVLQVNDIREDQEIALPELPTGIYIVKVYSGKITLHLQLAITK